jgi:hypothetical protein
VETSVLPTPLVTPAIKSLGTFVAFWDCITTGMMWSADDMSSSNLDDRFLLNSIKVLFVYPGKLLSLDCQCIANQCARISVYHQILKRCKLSHPAFFQLMDASGDIHHYQCRLMEGQ